jgi:isopenicillin-N epimerase
MSLLSRRELLAGAGVVLAGATLAGATLAGGFVAAGCAANGEARRRRPIHPTGEWGEVRELFDLDPELIHLAGLLLSSHPEPVRDLLQDHRIALDREPVFAWSDRFEENEQAARDAAARYIGGREADIALTDSTTMGLALIYNGVRIRSDQEFLTTVHDHPVTHRSIEHRADRSGVPVRRITLYEDSRTATEEEIVRRFRDGLSERTRVAAVTWVHSNTGAKMPIAQMAEVVAEANRGRAEEDRILLCVDGVHGFGVEALDIGAMGCDFFSAGCHKWLFGPRGTGVLWGRPETQEVVTPTIPSFSGQFSWGRRMTPGGFHSFEHRWALHPAFELHGEIGPGRVQERIHQLARQCKEGLRDLPNVTVHTPMPQELSAGIVCFAVGGLSAEAVEARLRQRGIVGSASPYRPSYARLTPAIFNSSADVEQALRAVRELA